VACPQSEIAYGASPEIRHDSCPRAGKTVTN
jgi:hypothetical protein